MFPHHPHRTADACGSASPASALWGRGGRAADRAVLVTLTLACGLAASGAILTPVARSGPVGACVFPVGCPTLPTTSLPTLPLGTTGTTAPPADDTTANAPDSSAAAGTQRGGTDTEAAPTAPAAVAAPLTISVRATVMGRGASRRVTVRLSLSRAATITARLRRGRSIVAANRLAGHAGTNRIQLAVRHRAARGRYVVSLALRSESGTLEVVNRPILLGP